MRFNGNTEVLKVTEDLIHFSEISGPSMIEQQKLVEHVEYLRGWLMDTDHHRSLLLDGVTLQYLDQGGGRLTIETGRRLLRANESKTTVIYGDKGVCTKT